jgi:hypothetical protein
MGFTPKGSVHAVGFDSRSLRIKTLSHTGNDPKDTGEEQLERC